MKDQNFNPEREFEKELRKTLEAEIFDIQPEDWRLIRNEAIFSLESTSIDSMGCDLKTYKSLVNHALSNEPAFNLFEISFLLNSINKISKKDLNACSLPEYLKLIEVVDNLMKEWNKKADPIKKKVANKIRTKISLNIPNNGKMVNPNLRKS